MNSRELHPSKISRKILRRLVPGAWPGTVAAIFERSLNVEMRGGFLIHIGSDALPMTPRSILLREGDFEKRMLAVCFFGQPVAIENRVVACGETRVNLFHPGTRLYDPRMDLPGKLLPPPESWDRLAAALQEIEAARERKGEGSFSPFRGYFLSRILVIGKHAWGSSPGPCMLSGESDLSMQMKNTLWRRADGCLSALSRQEWGEARAYARGLIGLGPGLTPSGDDFLAGFISAGVILKGHFGDGGISQEAVNMAPPMIKEEAAGRTTSISAAMLEDAAEGEVAEPVKHFLLSVVQDGEAEEIHFWAGEICRIGASSGEDLLNGLASGVLFFQGLAGQGDRAPLKENVCFARP